MSALDYIGLCSGDPDFVARWNAACREDHANEQKWIAFLRSKGVKAAHPDDGWVDREQNTVQLVYPQFDDGVKEGDRIALGWPFDKTFDKTRVVRITRIERSRFFGDSVTYHFEADRLEPWPV